MAHGNAVVHGDGVELFGHTTGRLNLARHQLAEVFQMHVAGHELGERIHHGNDGFVEIAIFHAGGTPQRAGTSHVATSGSGFGTVDRHGGK